MDKNIVTGTGINMPSLGDISIPNMEHGHNLSGGSRGSSFGSYEPPSRLEDHTHPYISQP